MMQFANCAMGIFVYSASKYGGGKREAFWRFCSKNAALLTKILWKKHTKDVNALEKSSAVWL